MESVKKFYTYIHIRNDTSEVFYVGKGRGKRAYSKYCRNNLWHKIANKHGYTVMIIFLWDSEEKAFEHEKELIKTYRENGNLLANFTDGGDGISGYKHNEESRAFRESEEGRKAFSDRVKKYWKSEKAQTEEAKIQRSQAIKRAWETRRANKCK